MIRRLLGPLLTALLAIPASAETVDLLFQNWTSQQGLPQDHIRAIVRTRDGFLWLATDSGLARFDGSEFKTYGLREGLGAVAVMSLLEAGDGSLWIGTLGGGVSVMRKGRIERTYTREDGLSSGVVPVLSEDDAGKIWVAGIYRLENDRFTLVPGPVNAAKSAFRDREGAMWISSMGKCWKDGKWTEIAQGGPKTGQVFAEDGAGRLWIVDIERKLWRRDESGWQSWPLPESIRGRANSITASADGTIWVACFRSGVFGFRDGKFIEPHTGSQNVLDLAEIVFASPDGLLWVGSSTHGLYSLAPRRIEIATIENPNANRGANHIGGLVEDAPGVFIAGTQGRGLFRWKGGDSEPVMELGSRNDGLLGNVMLKTRAGEIWAGTGSGLFRFHPAGSELSPLERNHLPVVLDLFEDREDGLWIGGANGELFRYTDALREVNYGSSSGELIKGFAQEPDGTLWIGTRGNGLFRLQRDGTSKRFGKADGLLSEVIRVIHLSGDGTLWVGSAGGGLSLLRGGRFHSITMANGLPDDIISQIHEAPDGRLWIGTNRGIAVLAKDEVVALKQGGSGPFHPLVINRADGLAAEECTIVPPVRMDDGRLAFATTHGFAMLNSDDFHADTITPPVFIERVRANGKVVEPVNGKLDLPPGLERLELEFTGLHFAAPKRLLFRNRLTGLEEEWGSASSLRRVEYRNLAPGDYRFELVGSIGNGLWTPSPAALNITLAPHFWQTQSFRIIAGFSALVLVVIIARAYERALVRRNIEALKREQAVHAERARIARDLHDDVGSSLTQVALLSELANSDLDEAPDLARGHINEIFTTAKDVTRALDEIVWAVNPAQDTLERFAAFLGTFVQNYARTASLNGRLDIPEELPDITLTSAIRHHLYLATKEVLHNIVKHAEASEVRLRLIPGDKDLRVIIEDNGRGLDPHDRGEGDGLGNLCRRLEQVGGRCTYRSVSGQGTTVEMTVPLNA